MEVESKRVMIQGVEYLFRPNFRAFMEYEELSGKSVNQIESMKDSAMFIYSGIKAGEIHAKREFSISFDEFIDMLDGLDFLSVLGDDKPKKTRQKKMTQVK